jgi:hypothetical protein
MIKRYGGPTPGDIVAALFRRHGVDVDPARLEDRAAAVRSRRKIDDAAGVEHVRRLAIAVRKARREVELCEFDWRLNPNSDTLHAARAAQQARTAAENELREQLLGDQDLFADVMRSVGR